MKSITLDVCQGVGDIFWVYQKFAPHFDEINFNVCRILGLAHEKLQNRSAPFLRLLPKVREIGHRDINHWAYIKLASKTFKMEDTLVEAETNGRTYYSCNKPLEEEIRLEDIDPEYDIEETVDIHTEPFDVSDHYVCLYVSGNTWLDRCKPEVWTVEQWVELTQGFYEKFDLKHPLVLVGASYDEDVLTAVTARLVEAGRPSTVYIDLPPANLLYVIKKSDYFLNYASGLGILADNMDVSQIMIYPKSIGGLLYSWCKERNLDSNTYNAFLFNDSPQDVLKRVDL